MAEGPGKLYFPKAEPIRQLTGGDKQQEAAHAKQWIASLSDETVCAYSDGSSCGPARSAWGYILYKGGQMIGSDAGPLPGAEVYDAEIFGAQKALEGAIGKAGSSPIKVLLDNSIAARALQTGRTKSSQAVVDTFTRLVRRARSVEIRWIPAHSGITGNEEADRLAKEALRKLPAETTTDPSTIKDGLKYTFAALNRFVRQRCEEAVESWWLKHRPSRYEELDLRMKRKRPPELALPRWAHHHLVAARTGHGDFRNYHERFGHEWENCKCVCGREKRPWHFAECRIALRHWREEKHEPPPSGREMLAEKGGGKFLQFLTVTKCYEMQSANRED